jgi:hypothetical protein
MTQLESRKHSPSQEIFLVNCISHKWLPSYAQGGSGWLFSRATAAHLYGVREDWIRSLTTVDDDNFGTFLATMAIQVEDTDSETFFWHSPWIDVW